MSNQRGYITLLSTLFLVAIAGVVAGSLILLGLGFSKTSFSLDQSNQAKALANACAEEALEKIQESTPFSGSATLNLGNGSCSYTVTKLSGQNRTIVSSGTVSTIIRKISISIDKITPNINITSWQEVADF
ncbi:TPA: hypothetical protein DEP06_04080 [Candidatus Daviesbacteria bacterium]|nr:hypothetical protein [Candidatus Daviesbacteria bacterium]